MDGTLAIVFAVIGLVDMVQQDCPTGCLARSPEAERIYVQGAGVQFQTDWLGSEVVVGYDFDRAYGPFQPTIAASVTEQGDVWVGGGAKWRVQAGQTDFFYEGSFQPGIYVRGDGPDLGGKLHFRSALGVGYEFDNGGAVLVSFDHRSNGDLQRINPGLETLSVQYSIALD